MKGTVDISIFCRICFSAVFLKYYLLMQFIAGDNNYIYLLKTTKIPLPRKRQGED
jgi:hypothetical protein